MSITNLFRKATALSLGGAMLIASFVPAISDAAHVDVHMTGAAATVLTQNGGSVVQTFSPDLDLDSSTSAELEANATTSTEAYYGVRAVSATSSPDVHWEITIDHATEALASGDVDVVEVGTFDVDSGQVRVSPATYMTVESSGNLVLSGSISGWSLASGEDMTNIDRITFAADAPVGVYTITRVLVNETTGADFSNSFGFTVDLEAAPATTTPDTTAPSAPVVTFPTTPSSTSTNPILVYGTAEADSSIMITGGASTSTATTSGAGVWSASVTLTASSTNHLMVTATDASGNVSVATELHITATSTEDDGGGSGTTTTATSSPIITLEGENPLNIRICDVGEGETYVEAGFSAVDSAGVAISATSTGTVDFGTVGTYTIIYTATDSEDHTATTTRTVNVVQCSSGGGGGGGGGSRARGIVRAAAVTPPATSIAGEAIGLNTLQTFLLPPGQVLGAATVNDPVRLAQIAAIKSQLAALITQLIVQLQAELQIALANSSSLSTGTAPGQSVSTR